MAKEICGKCSSHNTTVQRLKSIAFDMHEQIISLRKANAAMAIELDTFKKQKNHVVDVENKHVVATNEAVVKAVGGVVVRYEKKLSCMEKNTEFYKKEMVRASESLERLRSFCRNLPNDLRVQVLAHHNADKNTRNQEEQFKNAQVEAYTHAQQLSQFQAKIQARSEAYRVQDEARANSQVNMTDFQKRVSEAAARLRNDIAQSNYRLKREEREEELGNRDNKRSRT